LKQKKKEVEALKQKFYAAKNGQDAEAMKEILGVMSAFEEKKKSKAALRVQNEDSGIKRWTIEELRKKPAGLNAARLESYLSDADFKAIFKMTKFQFKDAPDWKKKKLKQDAGLL